MVTFGSRFGVSTGAIRDLCSLAKRDDDRKCPIGKHDGAVVDCSSRWILTSAVGRLVFAVIGLSFLHFHLEASLG